MPGTGSLKPSINHLLSDSDITALSAPDARYARIHHIDMALQDLEVAYKTAGRLPLNLWKLLPQRHRSHIPELPEDESARTVNLAAELSSRQRKLASLSRSEILLLRRALCTRRNDLTSIACLPTEILSSILELCPSIDADKPEFKSAEFLLGLSVSQVCRRWREIANHSSFFWSKLVVSRPHWALELLIRSRAAPLVVGLDFELVSKNAVVARETVLAQLPRIRELHIHTTDFSSLPDQLLLRPAPIILDTLGLSSTEPQILAVELFNRETPALQHLSLHRCFLGTDSALWKHLKSLELIYAPLHLVPQLNMDAFLDIFRNIPHLRSLTLNDSFPRTLVASTSEIAYLPLESLKVVGSIWQCYCVLLAISAPHSRIVLLCQPDRRWQLSANANIQNTPYPPSHLERMWLALQRHRMEATDPVITDVKISDPLVLSDGVIPFEINFFNQYTPLNAPTYPRYTVCLYRLSGGPFVQRWREMIVSGLADYMALDQLAGFTVKSYGLKLPLSSLHFPALSHVVLYHDAAPLTQDVEGSLLPSPSRLWDRIHGANDLLQLQSVTLHCITFSSEQLDSLLMWLARRKRLNLGLEELRFVDCVLEPGEVRSFKGLARQITTEDTAQ
ncbi:hypothetical protein R3P38DRAFT_321273 [Favolaschia claudopus]|uniref:F-box domain-containing protein n=1 Tax=Favolaschia claudopus TaxID=2862362 RepID=A0AAW0CU26_9AGAR